MSPTSRLQICRAEEKAAKRAILELNARSDVATAELDEQIAEVRAKHAANPTKESERRIQSLKTTIREHISYADDTEKILNLFHAKARLLVQITQCGHREDFELMSHAEKVENFESGNVDYELFRIASNLMELRKAYEIERADKPSPEVDILLTVSEEIIAGKYAKPADGELWNDWLAAVKR